MIQIAAKVNALKDIP